MKSSKTILEKCILLLKDATCIILATIQPNDNQSDIKR
jgi:hypothetical protein